MDIGKSALVALGVALVGGTSIYWAINFINTNGYSWVFLILLSPLILVTLISSIIVLLFSLLFLYIYLYGSLRLIVVPFIITLIGIETVDQIISIEHFSDDGDVCVRGVYHYYDLRGREYKSDFRVCYHWPSNEQWERVMQCYSLGAQNPVYYIRGIQHIHHMKVDLL